MTMMTVKTYINQHDRSSAYPISVCRDDLGHLRLTQTDNRAISNDLNDASRTAISTPEIPTASLIASKSVGRLAPPAVPLPLAVGRSSTGVGNLWGTCIQSSRRQRR